MCVARRDSAAGGMRMITASFPRVRPKETGRLGMGLLPRLHSARLGQQRKLAAQVAAWERKRNAKRVCLHWTFTLAVARQKLRTLYPSIED
jgi:hypothetical protein